VFHREDGNTHLRAFAVVHKRLWPDARPNNTKDLTRIWTNEQATEYHTLCQQSSN